MIGSLKRADLTKVKTICTHGFCPDGQASAMILHDAFPDAEIKFLLHGTDEYKDLPATEGMLFCDIAPPRDRWGEFLAKDAVVLDHHKQSLPECAPFCDASLGFFASETDDPGVSGALLAFEAWFCIPHLETSRKPIKDFATLAGIRDTWQKQSPRWLEACHQKEVLMFLTPEELIDHGPFLSPAQMELGKRLWDRHMRSVEHAADGAVRIKSVKYEALVMNAAGNIVSDASDILFDKHPPDFVAGFTFRYEDGRLKLTWSLRSRGAFDVGAFCKRLGGGGHTQAAGFSRDAREERGTGCNPYEMLFGELRLWEQL